MDIHSHVLPGIDDGPEDLDQSLQMASAAAASGTETLAATPHLHSGFPDVHVDELADRCRALQDALDERDISIDIISGAEISLEWLLEASDEDLKLASYGQRGTDLLVETPTLNAKSVELVLPHLQEKGYRITLAHPERGLTVQHDHEWLRLLVDRGLLLAVNAESLLSRHRSGPGAIARTLCSEGLVHALASDGHRAREWRPVTTLPQAVEAAAALVGPERASWMTHEAPSAILKGENLPIPPPLQPQGRRRLLFGRR